MKASFNSFSNRTTKNVHAKKLKFSSVLKFKQAGIYDNNEISIIKKYKSSIIRILSSYIHSIFFTSYFFPDALEFVPMR